MDKLYAKLSEQHSIMEQQKEAQKSSGNEDPYMRGLESQSSSNSLPITPAAEGFSASTVPTTRSASATPNEGQTTSEELLRLKLELAEAQSKISRLDQELAQTRMAKQDSGRATPAFIADADYASVMPPVASPAASRAHAGGLVFNAAGKVTPFIREQNWIAQDDTRSDINDSLAPGGFNRTRAIWNTNKPSFGAGFPQGQLMADGAQSTPWANSRALTHEPTFPPSGMDMYRQDRMAADQDGMRPIGRRGNRYDHRYASSGNFGGGFGGYNMPAGPYESGSAYPSGPQGVMTGGMGIGMYSSYQQQPVGTPLSPHATEFTSSGAPWKAESLASEGQTYVSPTTEPLNYRRLLDRNVTCDWKYIVDKIVCNNDQQASIFLQQKLKVGTPEQKYDIVEAIVAQAYPLMVNRFGNFLVQRCFEHGTPEQVIKIAEAIRGNTLNLSMDPFGCHVVQKAFDSVPEEYKAIMVHELLRRIPETVIHRYACHVWQKLFELRWAESPPQIMKYVNEALRGMWHEVALGETGSLVVQNIFENCLEEDKRPCIEEVLANIDIVAHGQFGNWCIQHICEHGAPADRSRAIDHVIRYAAEYSMDQFASKVVEKCLKIGGSEFLSRYLDRVCEGRVDRPRIPLIDIASDQYGNYLIQYILTHAAPQHREIVAAHIRKHMVSLRGSKFGSRVGMLCTNHAAATRPGPGVGPMPGRMASSRYGGGYR
ncbi:uncharacterized protein THITE_2124057 [Thermothielavioides terrestris NRRL 8126]|uniref:PUM-HD domain-containing protein n=1 Tax=Thermothielavioides terrestris (strain ATCC 38088 / NRRL 8126) TaxID=578455 RepID=G2RI82_THETT|nr:uncharacterized protein THITE_2124057 [Thermothielavioides terrestris NRRL 8126]AEO71544.1 hypothetical protein THITE_2124057 [Thermothielavioides terrestris NRRL 8126]